MAKKKDEVIETPEASTPEELVVEVTADAVEEVIVETPVVEPIVEDAAVEAADVVADSASKAVEDISDCAHASHDVVKNRLGKVKVCHHCKKIFK